MNPVLQPSPSQVSFTWWILWGAMCLSLVLMGVVLFFALADGQDEPPAVSGAVDSALTLIAAGIAGAALALRRFLSSDARLRASAEAAARLPRDARLGAFLQGQTTLLIVPLALHEAAALCGFVLAFLHREPARYLPFLAAALVLNALARPRPPELLLERARTLAPQVFA